MVACHSALFIEKVVRDLQGFQQILDSRYLPVKTFLQTGNILPPARRKKIHRLVRPPGRSHNLPAHRLVQGGVMLQRIGRIVRTAHGFDLHSFKKALGIVGTHRKNRLRLFPDIFPGIRTQKNITDPDGPEIQMNPFVHRIPDQFGKHAGQFHPFLFRTCVTGYEFFFHTAFPHDFPHIMICSRKKCPRIGKLHIPCNLCNIRMIVNIHHRKIRHLVVQNKRGFVLQQISAVQKSHIFSSFLNSYLQEAFQYIPLPWRIPRKIPSSLENIVLSPCFPILFLL